MFKPTRQEFSIKVCPSDEISLLENTLNSMSKEGWDLYSIYESDNGSKIVYNCLFVREVENIYDEAEFEDILGFKSQMEKIHLFVLLFYSHASRGVASPRPKAYVGCKACYEAH